MKRKYICELPVCLAGLILAGCHLDMQIYGAGSIESQSGNYDCAEAACQYEVPEEGLNETFEAVPDEGYEFTGWDKPCDTEQTSTTNALIPSWATGYAISYPLIARFRKIGSAEICPLMGGYRATGNWDAGGGESFNSPRNHHYTFEVSEETLLHIDIEASGEEPRLYLLHEGAPLSEFTYANYNTYSFQSEGVINAGAYTLVVGTREPLKSGTYQVAVLAEDVDTNTPKAGLIQNFSLVDRDRFTKQDTIEEGAGNSGLSFRNHHYSLTITETGYLDILVESPEEQPRIWLLDESDYPVINGESSYIEYSPRHEVEVTAGTYNLVIGTYDSLESGAYTLTLVGEIENLTKREDSRTEELTGAWTDAGKTRGDPGNVQYTLTVTEDSLLDFYVDSPEEQPRIWLLNESDYPVINGESSYIEYSPRHEVEVSAGNYTIEIGTLDDAQSGSFKLNVNGLFTDLVKVID